jgi:hypothetical protein
MTTTLSHSLPLSVSVQLVNTRRDNRAKWFSHGVREGDQGAGDFQASRRLDSQQTKPVRISDRGFKVRAGNVDSAAQESGAPLRALAVLQGGRSTRHSRWSLDGGHCRLGSRGSRARPAFSIMALKFSVF